MKHVIGADLSYTRTGLVVLDERYKLIEQMTFTSKLGPKRLLRAMKHFKEVIAVNYATLCVIEDLAFAAPNPVVTMKLAELAAIFKVVLEAKGIDYLVVSPSTIKRSITGKGNATKDVVAREIKRLYGIEFERDPGYDLSDATACAVWGVKHLKEGR